MIWTTDEALCDHLRGLVNGHRSNKRLIRRGLLGVGGGAGNGEMGDRKRDKGIRQGVHVTTNYELLSDTVHMYM